MGSKANKRVLLAGVLGLAKGFMQFKLDEQTERRREQAELVKMQRLEALQRERMALEHGYRMQEGEVAHERTLERDDLGRKHDITVLDKEHGNTVKLEGVRSAHRKDEAVLDSSLNVNEQAHATDEQIRARRAETGIKRNEKLWNDTFDASMAEQGHGPGRTGSTRFITITNATTGDQQQVPEGSKIPSGWFTGSKAPTLPRKPRGQQQQTDWAKRGYGGVQVIEPE